MKHTDKYYIDRIKKNLKLKNNDYTRYSFRSRSTPKEQGVKIECDRVDNNGNGQPRHAIIKESTSREKLYYETEYYKKNGYLI